MALSDILAAMFDPASTPGYDQGVVQGNNPQSPMGAAIASAGLAPQAYGSAVIPPGYGQQPVNNPGQAQALQAAQVANMSAGRTPVSQAMAPQAPPPQTPMAQAMAPQQQAPATPIGQAMSPMTPIQQQFNNQASNPNLALGQGMMAAGGAMLQGRNLMDGLGAAASNFGPAYNNTLNMQRSLNTPTVTPLADGAFTQIQYPGQAPTTVPNGEVQNFIMGKMQAQAQYALNKQTALKDDTIQVNAAKTDQQQGVAAQNSLINLQQSQQGIQAAQGVTDQLKQDSGRASALKVYSALPAVGQRLAAASGNPTMVQAAQDYNTLNNAALDATKFEVSGINGSLSNDEFNKAAGAIPKPSDDPAVWDTYYQRAGPLLAGRQQFYTAIAQRGLSAGNREVNPGGDNGRPVVAAPQPNGPTGSGTAPQVTDAASYAAIPAGGYYTDPSGKIRQKGTQ